MRRMLVGTAVVGLLLTILPGCASRAAHSMPGAAAPTATWGKRGGPAWQPAPARPGEVVYPGFGVRTMPAPATAAAAVGEVAARSAVANEHFPWLVGASTVQLREVTTGDFAPGSNAPKATRLAWVFTYPDTPMMQMGGMYKPQASPMPYPQMIAKSASPLPVQSNCVFTVIVDATTGDSTDTFQDCPPTP